MRLDRNGEPFYIENAYPLTDNRGGSMRIVLLSFLLLLFTGFVMAGDQYGAGCVKAVGFVAEEDGGMIVDGAIVVEDGVVIVPPVPIIVGAVVVCDDDGIIFSMSRSSVTSGLMASDIGIMKTGHYTNAFRRPQDRVSWS